MSARDEFDADRETRWCLDQVRRGLETYDSMIALITMTPRQEAFVRTMDPTTAGMAAIRRLEILRRFEFQARQQSLG